VSVFQKISKRASEANAMSVRWEQAVTTNAQAQYADRLREALTDIQSECVVGALAVPAAHKTLYVDPMAYIHAELLRVEQGFFRTFEDMPESMSVPLTSVFAVLALYGYPKQEAAQ
jgi:hypothetical protein